MVRTLALAQLLALKLMAWRDDVDFDDGLRILRALAAENDCSSAEMILRLVAPYFVASHRLKASYAVEELWELHDAARTDRSRDPGEPPA
jgi:hypothetical protein